MVDPFGNGQGTIYIAGGTRSTEATFPETGAPDLTNNGGQHAFVAKLTS